MKQYVVDAFTDRVFHSNQAAVCVLDGEQTVRDLKPDLEKIKQIDGLLLHVTARGRDEDCVSRSFAPKLSVAEDPVCGSGHCHIIPYWADRLGKEEPVAYQASKRGGTLNCRREGSKIFMVGKALSLPPTE